MSDKSVLISIQPQWCKLIADGKKTMEVRKTKPNLKPPFKVYIYCTNKEVLAQSSMEGLYFTASRNSEAELIWWGSKILNGKVIGEFVCDSIIRHCEMSNADIAEQQGYIKREKLLQYSNGKELYGWHISNLVVYDKPKELSEFKPWKRECLYEHLGFAIPKCEECLECKVKRPPQSWCYVNEEE